jgi:hypothetical protein
MLPPSEALVRWHNGVAILRDPYTTSPHDNKLSDYDVQPDGYANDNGKGHVGWLDADQFRRYFACLDAPFAEGESLGEHLLAHCAPMFKFEDSPSKVVASCGEATCAWCDSGEDGTYHLFYTRMAWEVGQCAGVEVLPLNPKQELANALHLMSPENRQDDDDGNPGQGPLCMPWNETCGEIKFPFGGGNGDVDRLDIPTVSASIKRNAALCGDVDCGPRGFCSFGQCVCFDAAVGGARCDERL